MEVQQNTLYVTTPGTYIKRDHLTLQVEVPGEEPSGIDKRQLSIPIHHLESICIFGISSLSVPALQLCWENGIAVNYLTEWGQLQARLTGVADTSLLVRRTQFRTADDPSRCLAIACQMIAGKIHNARNSLLRAAREAENPDESRELNNVIDALGRHLRDLPDQTQLDALRGVEGIASNLYFRVFTLTLKKQRDVFAFSGRNRRPPQDRINCLLSFLYALVRNDCVAALTSSGLDPFVGFLHTDRANRPSLALDLMEEFRPWIADRLAITLVNRQQIGPDYFLEREGGAIELTTQGRKAVIKAYQMRKQESLTHPILEKNFRIAQLPFIQARILARHLRGDIPNYLPLIPK